MLFILGCEGAFQIFLAYFSLAKNRGRCDWLILGAASASNDARTPYSRLMREIIKKFRAT